MPTAAQRHLTAIRSGEVAKTNIIGIRKAMNHVARLEARLSGNRSNATPADVAAIESAIAAHRPRVVGELHDSGLKLLRSPRYRARLESVRPIIDSLESFHLVEFEPFDSLHFVPVYEARGRAGSFKFRNVPWQSGGDGPEIISSAGPLPDVEFTASSFGGGWLAPCTDAARATGESIIGDAAEPMAAIGRDGWLVEPRDVADYVAAFREAGLTVTLS